MCQPDSQKALYLPPQRRRIGQRAVRHSQPKKASTSTWQPHQSDQALDAWGVALRRLKEQGQAY